MSDIIEDCMFYRVYESYYKMLLDTMCEKDITVSRFEFAHLCGSFKQSIEQLLAEQAKNKQLVERNTHYKNKLKEAIKIIKKECEFQIKNGMKIHKNSYETMLVYIEQTLIEVNNAN